MEKPLVIKRILSLSIMLLFITATANRYPVSAQTPEATPAFPVTIQHKFGSTTISGAPKRVVAIGYTEQDPLLALGVSPVAIRYWYGDKTDAIFSWAKEAAKGATPQVLELTFGGLNYEAILALKPDLISAVTSGISKEEYETLSKIAPTIAQSGNYIDFGMPWQETTLMIGEAVGKSAEAKALVKRLQDQLADVRAKNPAFAGKSIAVAYNYGDARTYGFYTSQDGRGRFFTDLGFVIPEDLVKVAGEKFYSDVSNERLDLLDRDVIVFLGLKFAKGGRAAIEADPLLRSLKAVKEGRIAFIPEAYDDALQFSSVLSLEYALKGIVPELQAAVKDTAATPAATRADAPQATATK
jgi:iron complex transport system substrate-binding protein